MTSAEITQAFVGSIVADLERYKRNLDALADGVYVESEKDGRIYKTLPDRQANVYLVDRILGKPTERVEAKTDNTHVSITDGPTLEKAADLLRSLGLARAINPVLPTQPDTAPSGVPAD